MSFKDDNEIMTDLLLYKWSEEDKKNLASVAWDDLILYHSTLGRWIRNHYNMWNPANPYSHFADSHDPNFPDERSQRIIETCWKKLKGVK